MISILLAAILSSAHTGPVPALDAARPAIDRGDRYLARFDFTTPGCWPSGSVMGTRGQAITVSRAGTRTCNVAAAGSAPQLITCQANEACVEASGLLVEPARTNFAVNSGSSCKAGNTADTGWTLLNAACVNDAAPDPLGGTSLDTVTTTNGTGSVYTVGNLGSATTGPVTISGFVASVSGANPQSIVGYANGAVINGPCTCWVSSGTCTVGGVGTVNPYAYATVGTDPVRMSLTCAGAATAQSLWNYSFHDGQFPTTFGVGGRTWGAQIEAGVYATNYIPTAASSAARNDDAVSIVNPLAANPATWCVEGVFTPENGRAWHADAARYPAMWAVGNVNAANGFGLFENAAVSLTLRVTDATVTPKAVLNVGPIAAGGRRLAASDQAGTMTVLVDRVSTGSPSGVGTGVISTQGVTMTLGSGTALSYFGGHIRDFKVWKRGCP